MNAWDIDPDFHLPVQRSLGQALHRSIGKLFRRRAAPAAPSLTGCGG
jgi:hypothetical protein